MKETLPEFYKLFHNLTASRDEIIKQNGVRVEEAEQLVRRGITVGQLTLPNETGHSDILYMPLKINPEPKVIPALQKEQEEPSEYDLYRQDIVRQGVIFQQ